MTAATVGPVRIDARLDDHLSRWLWLVKWLLVIPHLVVLSLLWVAFGVLSVVAFVAILVTGRYPEAIFEFTTGVLRWSWRVAYYAYGALGTDRYPPFTLAEVPDYPATLQIARPEHLSRGLVLVKWLLAVPHYLVIAVFVGGGTYAVSQVGGWAGSGGLIGLLVLIAGVALLFTGRYPRGVFDLLLGMHRWVLRVVAYAALMTDVYPPFRLDTGGSDIALVAESTPLTAPVPGVAPDPVPPTHGPWTPPRIVSVVIGSLLVATAVGMAAGASTLLVADRAGRDGAGFLTTPTEHLGTAGYALELNAVDLRAGAGAGDVDPGTFLGDVRVRAIGDDVPVFVGIGPAAAVAAYLADVDHTVLGGPTTDGRRDRLVSGGAPTGAPAVQPFWVASSSGPGPQQLTWSAAAGQWSVVVMNADGSRPVATAVTAGVSAPGLWLAWAGLYVSAAVALVAGAVFVGLAIPRRRSRAAAAPASS